MPFDLTALTRLVDIRSAPWGPACIVDAWRYVHVAQRTRRYSRSELGHLLNNPKAIPPFHRFCSETVRTWPDPICLNPPGQRLLSHDEMLIVDMTDAAARNDRAAFNGLLEDMLSEQARYGMWRTTRKLMTHFEMAM